MPKDSIRIKSINELHKIMGLQAPKHPLVTLIDATHINVTEDKLSIEIIYDFYMVSLKDSNCGVEYGRNTFDFGEGVIAFSAPNQVYKSTRVIRKGEINGWMLLFHPDLIRNTSLGSKMEDYSFFNYDVYEALHLSEEEEKLLNDTVANIQAEYTQDIDNHSNRVIISNIELLLNYTLRYYERQFNTRTHQNKDIIIQFEQQLKSYFQTEKYLESGLPSVQYFSDKAHLSKHYFSDLLKKETGKTPKNHINNYVVEQAKNLIVRTERSISEIAYELGFNYPHYFSRLFKAKTGYTPIEYRNLNFSTRS